MTRRRYRVRRVEKNIGTELFSTLYSLYIVLLRPFESEECNIKTLSEALSHQSLCKSKNSSVQLKLGSKASSAFVTTQPSSADLLAHSKKCKKVEQSNFCASTKSNFALGETHFAATYKGSILGIRRERGERERECIGKKQRKKT